MPENYVQTWDAILVSQQRVTIMSCSDKITMWNVAGVQVTFLTRYYVFSKHLFFDECTGSTPKLLFGANLH